MKDQIYDFVKSYVTAVEEGNVGNTNLQSIIAGTNINNPKLLEIRTKLLAIQNEETFQNILRLEKNNSLYDYLKILLCYVEQRNKLEYTITDISYRAFTPVMTIKRFENLESIANTDTLIKLLKVVGIKLSINFFFDDSCSIN